MSRAVMQQALEAMIEHGSPYLGHESAYQSSINALRAALAEPEQPYDQTALDLCAVCGWRTLIPGDACLNCERAKQPEKEPVAWLITDEKINSLQVASIQRLIDRAKYAHHTDVLLRINGTNERYEADWLKHMTRTAPPQRKPLTDEEIEWAIEGWWRDDLKMKYTEFARAIERAHGIGEQT